MSSKMSTRSTEETLLHHMQALGAGAVEATLDDYAEDASIFAPDGVLHGHDEIGPFLEASVTDLLPPGSDFRLLQQLVEGEVAYIVWSAESVNYSIPLGTDTFVVRDGQIVAQTFAALMKPKKA